jgi:hypothetical protein
MPLVLSPYEHGSTKRKKPDAERKVFISNSLALRQKWLERFGGEGDLPSRVQKGQRGGEHAVLLIGQELFHDQLWNVAQSHAQKIVAAKVDEV